MMSDVLDLSIPELVGQVQSGALKARQITEAALSRIEQTRALNSLLYVAKDAALSAADAVDAKRAQGAALGKLAGVPIAVKDALCTTDAPTTCASKILTRVGEGNSGGTDPSRGFRPPYDATVVQRLREADAILIGKAN
ncbi:MAG TPA: amidase family protein, partial [Polyangiaceae bacterium]|nr:amidase family protein [Polyangiaceae bacterium]